MQSKRARLDRFISSHTQIPKKQIRLILAQGRVTVDGQLARDIDLRVDQFSHIVFDGQVLQQRRACYIMLHKPVGVVCATKDEQHKTVIDLLDGTDNSDLHIVGRLDLNTSGLVLLTNDGQWSKRIMAPDHKVAKTYLVTLKNPLSQEYIEAFAQGFYFAFEDITTLPAQLTIVNAAQGHQALVTLYEGRYHQIKRMFGRFRNPVVALHRLSVGTLALDECLQPGQSRELTPQEVATI
ncbi:pseudouridine synthase [Shewanella algidipiscicola]|uniref:pseudouridine synthase n=1 Tax=Shewanella algidipiscicola TaxID=614070 RepID=UPI000E768D90|nr:pseudouridine synthase [Shewanella algidipiscicola]